MAPLTPDSDELNITEDSRYSESSSKTVRSPSPEADADSAPPTLASDELIPHPSSRFPATEDATVPSTSPESLTSSGVQLTAEIFASGAIPAGTMLGHFMIKSYIGGGGMGRVYLATDTALDRHVAVKVLPRQRAKDQSTVARFMNEAKSAARLNHEHIAQVYFAGEQDGIPFIVFEYVEGTNIRALVDDYDAFPLPQALNYLIQIAHALAHAADHGVVHRDVKPSNILITREGRAKLIDMGLARLLDPSEEKNDLTASGVTLGTFDYISPEQARDPRNADIRSDIYSLGCTFFFMLSGRPPFPEGTVLQKLLQHQGDEPPDIRSFQPNVPGEVALLLQKMMAKDPKLRFQTPDVLIESLVHVAKMIGLQPTGPGKLNWVMSPPSKTSQLLKHLPWIAAVALLMLIYLPLNLYWGQLGKQDILPKMPVIEEAVEESTDLSARFSASDAGRPPSGGTTTGESGLKPEGRISLNMVAYSPVPDEDEAIRFYFGGDPGMADRKRIRAAFRFQSGEEIGHGLAPPTIRESWPRIQHRGAVGFSELLAERKRSETRTGADADPGSVGKTTIYHVDPSGDTPGAFGSVAAALVVAGDGATIVLKWNDELKIDPMALTRRRLVFVAAENYRPLLVFEPSDTTIGAPNARSMILMTSCDLEFRDLAVEMRIRQDILASRWTLFETIGANKIRFSKTVLTIRNAASDHSAYHQEVAFFRNAALPSGFDQIPLGGAEEKTAATSPVFPGVPVDETPLLSESAESNGTADGGRSTVSSGNGRLEVRMSDSIMRGEATGLQCDVPNAVEFYVENTFIALAKSFVRTEDSKRATKPETAVQIDFDHVTYFGYQTFARQYRDSFDTEPMRLTFHVRDSILFLNHVPLALFRGASLTSVAFDSFRWSGGSNYFQDVSLGWRFRPSSEGGATYDMPISEWKEKMDPTVENDPETATKIDRLVFNEIRKPTHRLLPEDLVPKPVSETPGGAGPDISAGLFYERLPRTPESGAGGH